MMRAASFSLSPDDVSCFTAAILLCCSVIVIWGGGTTNRVSSSFPSLSFPAGADDICLAVIRGDMEALELFLVAAADDADDAVVCVVV